MAFINLSWLTIAILTFLGLGATVLGIYFVNHGDPVDKDDLLNPPGDQCAGFSLVMSGISVLIGQLGLVLLKLTA